MNCGVLVPTEDVVPPVPIVDKEDVVDDEDDEDETVVMRAKAQYLAVCVCSAGDRRRHAPKMLTFLFLHRFEYETRIKHDSVKFHFENHV